MTRVEIITSGTELVDGTVVDRNAAHIARQLTAQGLAVAAHYCIGDDLKRLTTALRQISRQSDVAIVTGGLGPTCDDRTAEAAAKAAGVELELNPTAMKMIERYFKVKNRLRSSANEKQAWLPKGAQCLNNPIGTAPGFAMTINQCRFFFLPGVYEEMQQILSEQVLPEISIPTRSPRHQRIIVTFGMTESAVGEKLADMHRICPDVTLGFRIVFPEIHIRLCPDHLAAGSVTTAMARATEIIFDRLGHNVVSADGQSVCETVGGLLRVREATVAVAESCTGGLVASLLTDIPGSSDYFLFAAVTYTNESKTAILGVPAQLIATKGAVDEQTAAKMAEGVRSLSGADFGIATTGIAGPTGATPGKPVGTVCIGIASANRTIARRYVFSFEDRAKNKRIFAVTALNLLRRILIGDIL